MNSKRRCKPMSRKLKLLSLCPMLLAMSGCVANMTGAASTPAADSYCRIAQGISYDSAKDTPETVKAVEAHNSRYECVCNNDCPQQP